MKRFHDRLSNASVHIAGCGRIGTAVALSLHAAGVGTISCNDPQVFEQEQLRNYEFSRRSDIGRPKVHVLERFIEGRSGLVFLPLVAPNESPEIERYLKRADAIVSCANRLEARLHLERAAVRLSKPCLQASARDSRQAPAGLISLWAPQADCSCFGCLISDRRPRFRRGEILLPSVTRLVADVAAHLVLTMLATRPAELARRHNVFAVDLEALMIEKLSVKPRPGCAICGALAKPSK